MQEMISKWMRGLSSYSKGEREMPNIPIATYRVQLQPEFGFESTTRILDYLADLGVSHLYASPYLQAAQGSTHGYDVVNHWKINHELGGLEGHTALRRALQKYDMGQVLDIVPNHMAISGSENVWWWDVLENGQSSRYASYFDVDWDPVETRFGDKILLPILGDHFGRILEAGEIRLERKGGKFFLHYYDNLFPASPGSVAPFLARAGEDMACHELVFLADALKSLPLPSVTDQASIRKRHRDKEVIHSLLERLLNHHLDVARLVDAFIKEINAHPDDLETLLDAQNYRLAFWRTANQDLGYRRFFDINSLVALRAEDEEVFEDSHRLILKWLKEGVLDGVRIDHPDGLRDPATYLGRLRRASPGTWVVVEKILDPDERVRPDWPVDGTTGYEFINLLTRLFIDHSSKQILSDFYAEFTGETREYKEVLWEKKLLIIDKIFGSDINRLTALMLTICEHHRRYRDYTRQEVSHALRKIVAYFPVYRTYVNAQAGWISDEDRRIIHQVIEHAKQMTPEVDPDLFDFINDILLLKEVGKSEFEFVMRLQQITPPVMAKGAEDTAFYCYNRFIALNEVGGDPGSFELDPEQFHSRMKERLEDYPLSMLSSSTHDTKRSEDVRARLVLLSEIPGAWKEAVQRWSSMARPYRKDDLPDRNIEYFLYQTLVGAWPIGIDRLLPYMEKASREAKTHTSWTEPDAFYEQTLRDFIVNLINDPVFSADLVSFIDPLIIPGHINSLSQTLIKLTSPGIPDIYQGCDLWDRSLVDPDNRKPVDFSKRRTLLARLEEPNPGQILGQMESGLPKLWIIRECLKLRRSLPEAFGEKGTYDPIQPHGRKSGFALGFIRGDRVAVIVPRLVLKRGEGWEDTWISLPAGTWDHVLTGKEFAGREIHIDELLKSFPVALLVKREGV